MNVQMIYRLFQTSAKAAGLQTEGDDKITFHSLRNSFITWLIAEGVFTPNLDPLVLS